MPDWRDIPGFEGVYQASSCGQIRSLKRTVIGTRGVAVHVPGCIKTQQVDRDGYPVVSLSKGAGKLQTYGVHPLVLAAFSGPKPHPTFQACHNDGDRANNAISNLRWASPADNYNDRRAHGTDASGEGNPAAKMTWAKVRLLRAVAEQFTQNELMAYFGMSQPQVSKIILRQAWV